MAIKNITKKELSAKELSILYDRIYDITDRLFKKYNFCNIHFANGRVLCASCLQNKKEYGRYLRDEDLCCFMCKHHNNGCMVKCLPCKLFVCNTYHKEYKTLKNRLKRLRNIATKHGIYTYAFFHTKKEVLKISKKRIKAGWTLW